MPKILLTGVNGQVGHALFALLNSQHLSSQFEVIAPTREQLDLTRADDIRRMVQAVQPSIIINPAAYTAVDKAESEPELAFAVNAMAPQVLAEEAAKINAALIHFSTDYVYDGSKQAAYLETDSVNPLGVYGKSKLAGEQAIIKVSLPHLILRTSWVYGAYGKNFLNTILRLAGEREQLRIVADQFGAPTSSLSIAEGVMRLLNRWQVDNTQQSGIYHYTNTGSTSWHGFARQIVQEYQALMTTHGMPALKAGVDQIEGISTAEYPTPAARPANSRLDSAKLNTTFALTLPDWQIALTQVMQTLA